MFYKVFIKGYNVFIKEHNANMKIELRAGQVK